MCYMRYNRYYTPTKLDLSNEIHFYFEYELTDDEKKHLAEVENTKVVITFYVLMYNLLSYSGVSDPVSCSLYQYDEVSTDGYFYRNALAFVSDILNFEQGKTYPDSKIIVEMTKSDYRKIEVEFKLWWDDFEYEYTHRWDD